MQNKKATIESHAFQLCILCIRGLRQGTDNLAFGRSLASLLYLVHGYFSAGF